MTTITVMGASGRTGGAIARRLLDAGLQLRVLARRAEPLAPLAARGARVLTGTADDATFLAAAFAGADAVYTLMPFDPAAAGYAERQQRQGEAIAQALRASGVRRVVALSSLGAEVPRGTGVLEALHAQEARLRAIPGLDLLLLRPAYYMDNLVEQLPAIRANGAWTDTLDPGRAQPFVATADVAAAAAQALIARDWQGEVVRELLGAADLTPREVAAIVGAAIGVPDLPYVRLGDREMEAALVEAGFAPDAAALSVALTQAMNSGLVKPLAGRRADNTTPTQFEDFARTVIARA